MSYYAYNFPPIEKFKTDTAGQAEKILEEAEEVEAAENDFDLVMETLDVIQACETMLRMFDERFVRDVKRKTIAKNANRDYYGKKGC